MPFALNLCYFFSKGNSGWYTLCLKSPSQNKLVYALFTFHSQTENTHNYFLKVDIDTKLPHLSTWIAVQLKEE
jgi:hypothetical protein